MAMASLSQLGAILKDRPVPQDEDEALVSLPAYAAGAESLDSLSNAEFFSRLGPPPRAARPSNEALRSALGAARPASVDQAFGIAGTDRNTSRARELSGLAGSLAGALGAGGGMAAGKILRKMGGQTDLKSLGVGNKPPTERDRTRTPLEAMLDNPTTRRAAVQESVARARGAGEESPLDRIMEFLGLAVQGLHPAGTAAGAAGVVRQAREKSGGS